MSKSKGIPAFVYNVEEKHRGDWKPLISTDKDGKKAGQKTVKITEETAETMNIDAEKVGIRYVKASDSKDDSKDDSNVEKDVMKMSKPEQEAKAQELGVEFTDEHTNQEKRGEYLKAAIEAKK